MRSDVWILIPAHNEAATLGDVISGAGEHCPNILVVDDGSDDETATIARECGCDIVRHNVNKGKGAALKSGFSRILRRDCSAVITIDGDGQHDTAEIVKFMEHYDKEKTDGIIIGSRSIDRESMPLYRAVPNRIGEFFISVAARRHIRDTQSGFRMYSREVIEETQCDADGFDLEAEILIKASRKGFEVVSIPVRTIYQENYTTHFRPVRDFYQISKVVLKNLV